MRPELSNEEAKRGISVSRYAIVGTELLADGADKVFPNGHASWSFTSEGGGYLIVHGVGAPAGHTVRIKLMPGVENLFCADKIITTGTTVALDATLVIKL